MDSGSLEATSTAIKQAWQDDLTRWTSIAPCYQDAMQQQLMLFQTLSLSVDPWFSYRDTFLIICIVFN